MFSEISHQARNLQTTLVSEGRLLRLPSLTHCHSHTHYQRIVHPSIHLLFHYTSIYYTSVCRTSRWSSCPIWSTTSTLASTSHSCPGTFSATTGTTWSPCFPSGWLPTSSRCSVSCAFSSTSSPSSTTSHPLTLPVLTGSTLGIQDVSVQSTMIHVFYV